MKFPSDIDAERALVAALAQDASNLERVSGAVSRSDFYDARYGMLYEALSNAYAAGIRVTSLVGLRSIARDLDP
jgi:replicative DNA helicase